jgi:hypothetical protein
MGNNGYKSAQQIAKAKRLVAVEECILKGITNQKQLAARFDVTPKTICQDIQQIKDRWADESQEQSRIKRARRVRQLERIVQEAISSFEKSRQDAVEITTQYVKVDCPECDGEDHKIKGCTTCDGKGTVLEERNTKRVKGQAGDSSFLTVAKNALAEAAKLEGLYPIRHQRKKVDQSRQIHIHNESKAPPELIIQAKEAMERIRQYSPDQIETNEDHKT